MDKYYEMTVGDLRKLLEDLPDSAYIVERDFDTSLLTIHPGQLQVYRGYLTFIPSRTAQFFEENPC